MTHDADTPVFRIAVVGSGPSGFYAADALLKSPAARFEVDLIDRLPTPYGLVRYGVAPDHPEIKRVVKVYARTASLPGARWFGGVRVGRDVEVDALRRHYHAIVFATGAETDRRLGIPGEDLAGSHAAGDFVAWYNGRPDASEFAFDLGVERAIVVGAGNVALDVARMLVRTPAELAATDVADHALPVFGSSRIREVLVVGRRGPAQAAFTLGELEELGRLEGADAMAHADELVLDEGVRRELAAHPDRQTEAKLSRLAEYAAPRPTSRPRRLVLRFLLAPTELLGDEAGHVRAVRLERNMLVASDRGGWAARPTGQMEEVEAGLVFRAVGYRGVALPGMPFDAARGTMPNELGRVLDGARERPLVGMYAVGWIKRGPSGVIGTNRPCALETVAALVEDVVAGRHLAPADPRPDALPERLAERSLRWFSFADWQRVDAIETSRGAAEGRPRVKMTSAAEMAAALDAEADEPTPS